MKRLIVMLTLVILASGALTAGAQTVVVAPAPAPPAAKYTGEVWTWDSARNIVTLYDAGRQFRVQTTPDQIARLNHHAVQTVTGVLLGPDAIETVLLPAQPMTAQASGPATSADVAGQITAIDTNGVATVESARGPLRVWLADNAQSRFATGRPVTVHVALQPVRMVAVAGSGGLASGPTLTVPASTPGDQAVVVGRVLSITPTGAVSIESPRGPITVWVPDAANFKPGDFVQVQTVVQPT
jgi:hypothetical protein